MDIVLIILILVIALVVGASFALGRKTYEVDSAKDTEFLELEGAWVRYSVMGGGPPVVLVHGWLSSSRVWEQLASRLAQRFTVYTLDLTGFGESDKPVSGYGVRYGSRLLFAFCAHFGLAKVSMIGHDLGGDMAVKLASDHPDVVGRIVLVATPANEEQIDLPTPLWAATLPVIGPAFYALGRAVRPVRSAWMNPFVSEPSDVTEEMLEDAASSTPAAMSQTLTVSRREIGGGRLARQARIIKVPALVIAGEEDQIVDPQAAGDWARSLGSAEVCLMDECGHMPMIERPGEFNAQILAFLTGDARYLEYTEQRTTDASPARDNGVDDTDDAEDDRDHRDYVEYSEDDESSPEYSSGPDFASEEMQTGGDTRRFHIRPEEGEAPAFGAAPDEEGDRDDSSDDVWSPTGSDDAPRDERGRGLREELEDTGGTFGDAARSRRHQDEPESPGTEDFVSPGDRERRERIDRSRFERDLDEPENADDEGEVRSLRDRFSGRRERRSDDADSRRRTFGSFDDGDDETPVRYGEEDPEPTRERPYESSSFRDHAEHPPEPEPQDERDPGTGESAFREVGESSGETGRSGEDESSDEMGEIRPPRARRRPRRESTQEGGGVPEVPPGLFDWGDSLDVFQPPSRDTGTDRGSSGHSGSRREDRDDTPDEPDDDPFGNPPRRSR